MKSPKSNIKPPVKSLIEAIRSLHGCKATWVESVPVKETFQGNIVWEGEVHTFEVTGHRTATRCYAWDYMDYTVDHGGKRGFFAVLHQGRVDSPVDAVRAAIVAELHQRMR